MLKRLLAVGDIHGEYGKLLSMWSKAAFNPEEDMIVFLGDYLDRGHENAEVAKWVLAHAGKSGMPEVCRCGAEIKAEPGRIVFLRGNHDQALMDWCRDAECSEWFYQKNGGIRSCVELKSAGILHLWNDMLRSMPFYCKVVYDGTTYLFAHGGYCPAEPFEEQSNALYYIWDREIAARPELHKGEEILVIGHTPVEFLGFEPVPQFCNQGHVVLMDTGSFLAEGRISCADLLSGKFWQS